ncbi:dihydrofolate reductase family protein [Myceligenerans crystallogenes]|uniref:dihydrofolate reductase family protein n=1 Tax=Myceligenerans crystallogenes TaxID=316335 RepID=UPI0031D7FE2C
MARRQGGLVSVVQCEEHGIGAGVRRRLVRSGEWSRVVPGVLDTGSIDPRLHPLDAADAGIPPDDLQRNIHDDDGDFIGRGDLLWYLGGGRWLMVISVDGSGSIVRDGMVAGPRTGPPGGDEFSAAASSDMRTAALALEDPMRTIVSTAFVSLDGKVDPTGGDPDLRDTAWTYRTVEMCEEMYELKGREQEEADGLLLGRRSYEMFAPVWPRMAEFERYNTLPKYVVSTALGDGDLVDDWGETTILRSLDEVARLKADGEGELQVHGSASLGRARADAGLVDRFDLLVFPVLLGQGKPLFSDTDKGAQRLRLVEHEVYANGVQKQVFDVVR